MSNFPYNFHRFLDYGEPNGAPITYKEALALADTVRYWHGVIKETDCWSESNDGADDDMRNMALGLLELLSDPGAIRRLMMIGETVKSRINDLLNTDFDVPDGRYSKMRVVLKEVLGIE